VEKKGFLARVLVLSIVMTFAIMAIAPPAGTGTFPRADRGIEVERGTLEEISNWYVGVLGNKLENLNVEYGELVCDNELTEKARCSFSIDNNLFSTKLYIQQNKCAGHDISSGECLRWEEKTPAEWKKEQETEYITKLYKTKEVFTERYARNEAVKVGEATITVTEEKQ